jgi:DeoR/GlpR family transcriptional regulator of sugar metabolism
MAHEESWTADERQQHILDRLMENGTVDVGGLAEALDVSRMTIHRDLDQLEDRNLLRKVRGGATIESSLLFESSYAHRSETSTAEKRAVSKAAAEYLKPGQAVMIDDSTTAEPLADFLSETVPHTVITNAFHLADRVRDTRQVELICLGGTYNSNFESFLGLFCERAIEALRADVLFMSTSAIKDGVAFHQNQDAARVKRAMMEVAETTLLLADHNKFGRSGLIQLADLTEFDQVLIGGELDTSVTSDLDEKGVSYRVVTLGTG